jgi:hypothetical protein
MPHMYSSGSLRGVLEHNRFDAEWSSAPSLLLHNSTIAERGALDWTNLYAGFIYNILHCFCTCREHNNVKHTYARTHTHAHTRILIYPAELILKSFGRYQCFSFLWRRLRRLYIPPTFAIHNIHNVGIVRYRTMP